MRPIKTALIKNMPLNNILVKTIFITIALSIIAFNHVNAQTVRIAGSSTVFPFSTVVAEQVGRRTGAPPIVESTGSGAGMKSICRKDVDIANVSRRIKASELKTCKQNNVNLYEFLVGRDGVVLAVNKDNNNFKSISLAQLYQALAKQLYINGKLLDNPNQTWRDIDKNLPNVKILIYGPPPTSGTRDALETLGLIKGAEAIPAMKALKKSDKKQFEKLAVTIREDGTYVEGGENDNLLIRKLADETNAVAIFGFSYLENNLASVRGIAIDDALPEFDYIIDGSYQLTRPLYFYVRQKSWSQTNLQNYVRAFISQTAIGEEGYLTDKGLVPLTAAEFKLQQNKLRNPIILSADMLR
ncbi:MAG: substrate-binding domain-containing protein [Alphaproteobacteria bacterium]|nr:substrate-binding domain-containing protein [Alphaproteobacteria bacterium]